MKKWRVRRWAWTLPIFEARIQLIVAEDILAEREKQKAIFGPLKDLNERHVAWLSYSGGHNFALFFKPDVLTHRIVDHELFHLTHRIIDWAGIPFDAKSHEAAALLMGELSTEVYLRLQKL